MSKTAFTEAHLAAWDKAFEKNKPNHPTEIEWPEMPQMESFASVAMNTGIIFRFHHQDNTETTIMINPFVARKLALTIMTLGKDSGWMNEKYDIILPPYPKLDS